MGFSSFSAICVLSVDRGHCFAMFGSWSMPANRFIGQLATRWVHSSSTLIGTNRQISLGDYSRRAVTGFDPTDRGVLLRLGEAAKPAGTRE
jgi:hypothetical protein